jgi:hypothetical protein
MRTHKDCDHGPGAAWVLDPTRQWFTRCDACNRFRLWGDYFEVYDWEPATCGWWECEQCLLKTVTAWGEKQAELAPRQVTGFTTGPEGF